MKPHSLFSIILKIVGVIFLKDFVVMLPQLFYLLPLIADKGITDSFILWQIVTIILSLMIYYVFIYFLIFETDFVIRKLKVLQSFTEESVNLNIHRSIIIHSVVLITGALIVITRLPYLVGSIIDFTKANNEFGGVLNDNNYIKTIVIDVIQVLIGIWLATNPRFVTAYIEKGMRKSKYNKNTDNLIE
jgi:hypothetical protein